MKEPTSGEHHAHLSKTVAKRQQFLSSQQNSMITLSQEKLHCLVGYVRGKYGPRTIAKTNNVYQLRNFLTFL